MIEEYLNRIKKDLELALSKNDFIGKLEVEINIKGSGIVNMNIATKESVRI